MVKWRRVKALGKAHAKGHKNNWRRHDAAEARHEHAIARFIAKPRNRRYVLALADQYMANTPGFDPEFSVPYLANRPAGDAQHEAWCWARFLTRGF